MIFWVLSLGTNLLASTERFSWSISPQGGPLPPPVRVCTQCLHRYRGVDPECFIHRFMNLFNIYLLTNTKFLCISQLKLCLLRGKINNLIMIFFAFSLICQVHVFCQYISVAVVFLFYKHKNHFVERETTLGTQPVFVTSLPILFCFSHCFWF